MRAHQLLLVGVCVVLFGSLLTGSLLTSDQVTVTPEQRAPEIPTWRRLSMYRWPTADGVITFRFAPYEIGPPTLLTIVDAGNGAQELWYLPWIHDSPEPNADPLPETYIESLADAFVHFGAQVDVVGMEGEFWMWDIRQDAVAPHADEVIGLNEAAVMRALPEALELEELLLPPLSPLERKRAVRRSATGVGRAGRELLLRTTIPVIGVESPDSYIPALEKVAGHTYDLDRSRERSRIAIATILTDLEARGGQRALLVFGVAHYAEIAERMHEIRDATLRVACIPALCEIADP
jgi:hypothetical protein